MRVIAARVVDGKIEVETDLKDGTAVAILAGGESGFRLTADEEDELFAAWQEIQSGDFEDGHELLRELRALSGR